MDNSFCVGTWTREWEEEVGSIPEEVQRHLNSSGNARLIEAFKNHECPFGIALPGDVTWPNPKKGLEGEVGRMDIVDFAMVVWSFTPYFVVIYLIALFVIHRGTRQLWTLVWVGLFVCANEIVIKRLVHQPRPGTFLEVRDYDGHFRGSCLKTCGMPSSHAGLTSGLFLLLFLEGVFRIGPQAPPGERRQDGPRNARVGRHGDSADALAPRRTIHDDCEECFALHRSRPPSAYKTLSRFEFVRYVWIWFIVLVPSSLARIVLYDHTAKQVIVGKIVGIVLAYIWWWIVRCLQYLYEGYVNKPICHGFLEHNFPVPDDWTDARDTPLDMDGFKVSQSESGSYSTSSASD